ncbi:MAG: hypothetical protein KY476_18585, partial [Planctomycetes bacterium]|nr:hypothetical protein [Planctomycetota bacterium]
GSRFAAHAGYVGWIAAVWLILAVTSRWPMLFAAGQVLSSAALALAVTAVCRALPWWTGSYADPRFVQWQLGALAAGALFWSLLRQAAARPALRELMAFRRLSVDSVLLWTALLGLLGVAAWGIIPGVAAELQLASTRLWPTTERTMLGIVLAWMLASLWPVSLGEFRRYAAIAFALAVVVFVAAAVLLPHPAVAAAILRARVSHAHAYGFGAWVVLGLVLAALVASFRERLTRASLSATVAATLTVPLLIAGRFETSGSVASALRWGLALYLLIAAAVLCCRSHAARVLSRISRVPREQVVSQLRFLEPLLLAATVLPVLGLTARYALAVASERLSAPAAGVVFERLGAPLSYAGAVGVLAASVGILAARYRRSQWMLAASLLVQAAVALGFALPRWLAEQPVSRADLIGQLQWNALALGGVSLVWLAARRRFSPAGSEPVDIAWSMALTPWDVQLALTAVLPLGLSAWATQTIVNAPGDLPAFSAQFGHAIGYAALIVACGAWLWRCRSDLSLAAVHTGSVFLLALAPLIAASVPPADVGRQWLSYHVLEAGWLLVATVGMGLCCVVVATSPMQRLSAGVGGAAEARAAAAIALVRWTTFAGGLVVLLAIRGLPADPARPWWSAATTAAVALLAFAVGVFGRRQSFAYASTVLAVAAVAFAWLTPFLGLGTRPTPQSAVDLFEAGLIARVTSGLVWLIADVWWQRRGDSVLDPQFPGPPAHHAAAVVGLAGAAFLAVVGLALQSTLGEAGVAVPDVSNPGGWTLAALLMLLTAGLLWDKTARYVTAQCYLAGLVLVTLLLDALQLSREYHRLALGLAASGYVLLTGLVWASRGWWGEALRRLGGHASPEERRRTVLWLTAANVLLAAGVVALEVRPVLTLPLMWPRLCAAAAVGLAALGLALLSHGRRVVWLPYLSLLVAGLAAVAFGWAPMPPQSGADAWLRRSVCLLVVLAIVTAACLVGLMRRATPQAPPTPNGATEAGGWIAAARRAAATFGLAAIATLLAVLVQEALLFVPRVGVESLSLAQVAVVAAALVALAAALVAMAVLPGRDPLQLEERGRRTYVYAAEAVLALLFLHVYLTVPDVFDRRFWRRWPFTVMGIAFCGVGLGELFRRLKLPVLSEPLERTAAFLPLLPAIGFWVHTRLWAADLAGRHSLLLFVVGLLYVVLSMWRQSFVYGATAALAGNVGLWLLWTEQDVAFLAHPQVWFIPPALSVLVAAHLNRDRLAEAQLTAIRYLTITVIYVSSTAEMFIAGAEDMWRPMVLAALSVLGVLAGILLRVRAFLYLGASFLLLAIVSMVWHAARNIGHTWPWWAFGVVLGLAVLALFGLFEKKRNEVLHVLDELRQWKP